MRIGLNLLYLLPDVVGGTETYAAGLLKGLASLNTKDEFIVFVNREVADWSLPAAANFTRVVCPVTGANRAQRYYFEQIKLPLLLRQRRIDLVHSLGYVGPIISPCQSVITIPDLNYIDLAETIPFHRRLPLRYVSTKAAKSASGIITISNFSKARLCRTLKLPTNKITVTHLAPSPEMISAPTEGWSDLRQRYGIQEPYIVAFGGGTRHKNIAALLQAFALLGKQMPHNLVLLGHLPPNVDIATTKQQQDSHRRVVTTGYVPGSHIRPLLSHAELFVLPSLYEGFGLPVLEAQQAGVAVACSTAGSLPEVAGDGAVFFDPKSVEAIAETMICCLSNVELQERMRQRGRENLTRFSWDKTARNTLKVYKQILTRRKNG